MNKNHLTPVAPTRCDNNEPEPKLHQPMDDQRLTFSELESRWTNALHATRLATAKHPYAYRELKSLAAYVVNNRIDIDAYFPTVEKLLDHMQRLDPAGRGSIFQIFSDRIKPTSIWQVRLLRMECKDLLAHLDAYDQWHRRQHNLKRIK